MGTEHVMGGRRFLAGAALLAGLGALLVAPAPANAATATGTGTGTATAYRAQSLQAAVRARAAVVLRVGRLLAFQQVKGAPSARARARVANAVFTFFDNGTFAFTTTDVRTDLYPLRGRYQINGDRVSLSAHGSSAIGGSSAFTEMVASIDFSSRPGVMTLDWANGAGYGAVVNGTRFGTGASSKIHARFTVVQG
ncbi:hypothetical protein [Nonomuraea rhodomycinica]|uniref:Polyisoprenoid-binding protein YceI n=1 Tax=Nonomuraea rhodomycinica TaxID=1712872 RepID=A0A7Y6MA53_9ACTN|nr:hypothetical protein [Nonomuraea rhodomycinica]NUW39316.1 hypothetical protein [Nonomuraea rhodomycinica]